MRVRFPSPDPPRNTRSGYVPRTRLSSRPWASTRFVPHTCHTRVPSHLTLSAFLLILRCLRGLLPYLTGPAAQHQIDGLPDDPNAAIPPEQALHIIHNFLAIQFPLL